MLRFVLVSLLFLGTACVNAEPPRADYMKLFTVEGSFANVRADVEMAITDRGMIINNVSHISNMLARTGKDIGAGTQIFAEAEALDCVSETLSAADPDALALLEVSGPRLDALSARLDLECVRTDYHGTGRHTAGGLAVCVPRGGSWQLSRQRSLDLPPNWKYVFTELRRGELAVNVLAVHFIPYGVHEGLAHLRIKESDRLAVLADDVPETRSELDSGRPGHVAMKVIANPPTAAGRIPGNHGLGPLAGGRGFLSGCAVRKSAGILCQGAETFSPR